MPAAEHHDVVVIGARVAGSLTAGLLAEAGIDVLVVERARWPSPVLSTHFFRGEHLIRVLALAGVLDDVLVLESPRLVREFNYSDGVATYLEGPAQDPGEVGYCLSVRRESLDPILLDGARRHGAVVETSTPVRAVVRDGDRVIGVDLAGGRRVSADLIIGADGYRSLVAAEVDAPKQMSSAGCRALYYRYVRGMAGPDGGAPSGPEFSLLGDELAYVFPSDDGWTCLAISINLAVYESFRHEVDTSFDRLLQRHAGLWPRYSMADNRSRVFGTGPREDFVRQAAGEGWALVGDSGVHQDPWSGAGMDSAGVSACLLAESILDASSLHSDGWAGAYQQARDAAVLDWFRNTVAAAPDLSVLVD